MTEYDERPIEVGDRFQDKDWRNEGRVVEVIFEPSSGFWHVRVEAHPKNPEAIGNVSRMQDRTLRERYRRISR